MGQARLRVVAGVSDLASYRSWSCRDSRSHERHGGGGVQPGRAHPGEHQQDKTTRLWELDVDRVASRVCDTAYPTLSQAEWNQHFSGLAYQPPCQQ